jgi:hypothetical protein
MKNVLFKAGILAFILVFGLAVVSCGDDSDETQITSENNPTGSNPNGSNPNGSNPSGSNPSDNNPDSGNKPGSGGINGTWYSSGNYYKYYFSNGNYEYYINANPYNKGTYTTTNDSMTMTITHIGYYFTSSSYTWLNPSTWYSRDEFVDSCVNYYREYYRSNVQQSYDLLVKEYGYSITNQAFNETYGTTNIDSIAEKLYGETLSLYRNQINTSADSLYTTSTVAYSLNGNTLILGGRSFTRE